MVTTNQAITQEQLNHCSRTIDESTGRVFYLVESESTPGLTYSVRWHGDHFSCTCPCGASGFSNCRANPTCKHVRWAAAHTQQYREAEREKAAAQARLIEEQAKTPIKKRGTPVRHYVLRTYTPQGNSTNIDLGYLPQPPIEQWQAWCSKPELSLLVLYRSGQKWLVQYQSLAAVA